MKSPLAWGCPEGDDPGPTLGFENELVDVVKPLLLLVDTSMDVHGCIVARGRVPVSPFYLPFATAESSDSHLTLARKFETLDVAESFLAIPAPKEVDLIPPAYCTVAEPLLQRVIVHLEPLRALRVEEEEV